MTNMPATSDAYPTTSNVPFDWKGNSLVHDAISKIPVYVTNFRNINTFNEINEFKDYDHHEIYDNKKNYISGAYRCDYGCGRGSLTYRNEVHHIVLYSTTYENCVASRVYIVAREWLSQRERLMYSYYCQCPKCRISKYMQCCGAYMTGDNCIKNNVYDISVLHKTRDYMIRNKILIMTK